MDNFLSAFGKLVDTTEEMKELLSINQEKLDSINRAISSSEGMVLHMRNFVKMHDAKKLLEDKIAVIKHKLPEGE